MEFGDPHLVAGNRILLLGYSHEIKKPVTAIKAIRTHCKIGMAEAKKAFEDCIGGQDVELVLDSIETAQKLAKKLENLGLLVKQLSSKSNGDR